MDRHAMHAAVTAWVQENQAMFHQTWSAWMQHAPSHPDIDWDWDADVPMARACHELLYLDHILQPALRFFMTMDQYKAFVPKHVQRGDAAMVARTPLLVVHGPYDVWKLACLDVLPRRELPQAVWWHAHIEALRNNGWIFKQYQHLLHLGCTVSACYFCRGVKDTHALETMFPKRHVLYCTSCARVCYDEERTGITWPRPNRFSLWLGPGPGLGLDADTDPDHIMFSRGIREMNASRVSSNRMNGRVRIALGLVPHIQPATMMRTSDMLARVPDGRLVLHPDPNQQPLEWHLALLESCDECVAYVDTNLVCPATLAALCERSLAFEFNKHIPKLHVVVPSVPALRRIMTRVWHHDVTRHVWFVTVLGSVTKDELAELGRIVAKHHLQAARVHRTEAPAWLTLLKNGQQVSYVPVTKNDIPHHETIEDEVCGNTSLSLFQTKKFSMSRCTSMALYNTGTLFRSTNPTRTLVLGSEQT